MGEKQRALRVGVLGAGPIAQAAHFEACRKAKNAELYAICEVAEDLLERMSAIQAPRKAYADYDAMLADPNVDAVIVAIADQFHVPMALEALEAGKHVLVEKPMGVTVEECEQLKERAEATGLVVQVGTEKRFDEGIAFAHDFVREEMGEMIALKAWYCDSTHRYTMTDAVQPVIEASEKSKRPEGDPKADLRRYHILAHASHLLDTARFLGGEIEAIRTRFVENFGGRVRQRKLGAPGSYDEGPHGLARGLPDLRGARQRRREDVQPLVLQVQRSGVLLGKGWPIPQALRRRRPLLQAAGRGVRRGDTRRCPDARGERGGRARGDARDGGDD
jgi:predicted dehydrogenase